MTSANNVRVPPLFPPTAVGIPFVPMVEDSAVLHASEEGPLVGDTLPSLLPPFRVASDYMGASRESDCSPVWGRISHFVQKWQVITSDSFILSVIKDGFQISVQSNFPVVLRKATVTPKDQKIILRIQEEIRDLICKNAIVQINDFPNLCLSPIFVIPKKSGDLRVILNLKEFNLFISSQHFRMETLNVILSQLSANDWAVSIDLKDAYLHILVHPQSRRFLGFQFMDMTYQYKVLPFGLTDSPGVFTRVVATLVGHLRHLGIRIFYYLDDWLLVAESKELLELHLQTTLQWTQDLGFLENWKKSSLVGRSLPWYRRGFLLISGRSWTSRTCWLVLWSIGPLVAEVPRPSGQFCGSSPQLQAADETSSVSPFAVLHSLDRSPGQTCPLESRGQGFVQGVGLPLSSSRRKAVCPSAASSGDIHRRFLSVLGGSSSSTPSVGVWSKAEASDHINSLDLKAVLLALQNLESRVVGQSVLIRSDNMTVVSFISYQGGTHFSSLCRLGMVPSEENLPSGSSHSGRRQHCGGFSLKGKISPIRMGLEALSLSQDLSCVVSSAGDRFVRFGAQFSAPEVLLSVPGRSCLEDRCAVVSLGESSSVRVSSFLSSPQDLGKDCSGQSGPSSGYPVLASETLVPSASSSFGRVSKDVASSKGSSGTTSVSVSSSQSRKSSSFSMASLRQQGEEAGLSQRAAQLSAEAIRQSTRDTYDSRLDSFREWCAKVPCDPTSASLGAVADFLISLFDSCYP